MSLLLHVIAEQKRGREREIVVGQLSLRPNHCDIHLNPFILCQKRFITSKVLHTYTYGTQRQRHILKPLQQNRDKNMRD